MPQFNVNFYYSQVFWLVIIFSCLYFSISKFTIPLAKKILNDRKFSIDSNIVYATRIAAQAKNLQQQYDNEIQKIQTLVGNSQEEILTAMNQNFLTTKALLSKELKAQIIKNNIDIEEDHKLFWSNKNQACLNSAALLIKKFTNQPVNMELLNKLYNKLT